MKTKRVVRAATGLVIDSDGTDFHTNVRSVYQKCLAEGAEHIEVHYTTIAHPVQGMVHSALLTGKIVSWEEQDEPTVDG
jgi:hypothetical protein